MKITKELNKLALPSLTWFIFFLAIPLALVFITSFLSRGTYGGIDWAFSIENYLRAFDWIYIKILFNSLILAALTTTICLILGYPMALAIATSNSKIRTIYIFATAIPFLSNLIIRIYALKVFVGYDGPLLWLLNSLQIEVDPYLISQNQFLVFFGMITTYLPFMVFPVYGALEKFDFTLVEAAEDLGANQLQIFFKILIPNTIKAIFSGCMLVFIPCLGEFIIPDLLGGAKTMLIGNLITEQFLKARDWPFGSALSMFLILILVGVIFFSTKSDHIKSKTNETAE